MSQAQLSNPSSRRCPRAFQISPSPPSRIIAYSPSLTLVYSPRSSTEFETPCLVHGRIREVNIHCTNTAGQLVSDPSIGSHRCIRTPANIRKVWYQFDRYSTLLIDSRPSTLISKTSHGGQGQGPLRLSKAHLPSGSHTCRCFPFKFEIARKTRLRPVKTYGHEAKASLLGGQPPDHSYQPYAGGYHHRQGIVSGPAGGGQLTKRMYKPNSPWTWAFVGVSFVQAAIVLGFEA